jgi:hypothetical protein
MLKIIRWNRRRLTCSGCRTHVKINGDNLNNVIRETNRNLRKKEKDVSNGKNERDWNKK